MRTGNFPGKKNARRIAALERAKLRLDSSKLLGAKSRTGHNPKADAQAIECLNQRVDLTHNLARAVRTKIRRGPVSSRYALQQGAMK